MDTIDWQLDRTQASTLYKQIIEKIKDKIANGEWPPGTKIPSQRSMSDILKVNRSTINTALNELIADGLLEASVGSGTRVANNSWSVLASSAALWTPYTHRGLQQPNLSTIQKINTYEFDDRVIRLGTGELSPEFYPKELMQDTLRSIGEHITSLGYEEPLGLYPLREELCRYLARLQIAATPASLLIVSGGLQALQLISLGLLNRSSTLYLERPSYLFSLNLFQSSGIALRGLPMDNEGISLEALQAVPATASRCLYTIPCFQNPTGTTMTEKRRAELYALCAAKRLPIIEDDVYRELWFDSPPPLPVKALDKQGLVLYIGSFSKALSPGLRLGWITGPEPVISRLADIKNQIDYGSSSLSQWAVHRLLASGAFYRHVDSLRGKLLARRTVCLQILEQYFAGIATWTVPQGGFYVWLTLKKPVSLNRLFYTALDNGLLLNPGNLYDKQASQNLRISYAYARLDDLATGLYRLAELIKTYRL
ncbi:aminotransferase-like domain-containing protein [Propionispora hippei]|uniref:GntR family transcriptional regulator, regulator for abcA and norABC n=1 Tax=Propionispora hippei DSM 15287 TaxID=1123003 RepID=A0A1M6G8R1_9FIRM|nr:PLP-dependent aminotransferase family protein [Propionispora hippei]SHJ06309.1 GntR family transcriptional regulator, regulator for abcA and norABC [Propionispora hippei DSM 15287]